MQRFFRNKKDPFIAKKSKTFVHIFIHLIFVLSIMLVISVSNLTEANTGKATYSQAELQQFKGHYSTKFGYLYIRAHKQFASVMIDGKFIRLIKKSDGRIYPHSKFLGLFPIKLSELSFSLVTHKGKRQVIMHSKKRRSKIVGQQFKPTPIPQNWTKRLGRYKAKLITGKANINTIILGTLNNVLVAYINDIKYPYPLLATSNSSLYSPSAGHNTKQKIKVSTHKNKLTLIYGNNILDLTKI